MWGLLVWTLLALHRIRATGAQGTEGHPHVGLGRVLEEGEGGGDSLASRGPPGHRA